MHSKQSGFCVVMFAKVWLNMAAYAGAPQTSDLRYAPAWRQILV